MADAGAIDAAGFWDRKWSGQSDVEASALVGGIKDCYAEQGSGERNWWFPASAKAEKVLTVLLARLCSSSTAEECPNTVSQADFRRLAAVFGPFPLLVHRLWHSLLLEGQVGLQPWWHGSLGRAQAQALFAGKPPSSFLFRFSSMSGKITVQYSVGSVTHNSLVSNVGVGGFGLDGKADPFETLGELVESFQALTHPIPSALAERVAADLAALPEDAAEAGGDGYGAFDGEGDEAGGDGYGAFDGEGNEAGGGGGDGYGAFDGEADDAGDGGAYGAFDGDGGGGDDGDAYGAFDGADDEAGGGAYGAFDD